MAQNILFEDKASSFTTKHNSRNVQTEVLQTYIYTQIDAELINVASRETLHIA